MAACRSCSAPIVWVRTKRRKLMPVDASLKVKNAVERNATATFEELQEKFGADVVVSHFATCPDADSHRHKRRRPRPESAGARRPETGEDRREVEVEMEHQERTQDEKAARVADAAPETAATAENGGAPAGAESAGGEATQQAPAADAAPTQQADPAPDAAPTESPSSSPPDAAS